MVNKQYSATDLEAFMKIAANWQSNNQNQTLLEGVDIKQEMQQYMNNPAMNMYKKRERTQNWNHQEKKFLLDLCRKDMRIIENKRLDAGLTAVKNKAWKIIHQKFSSQFGTDRTCNRLKEQWRRMKACTRNEILDYNTRVNRLGQVDADRKKPSPFTFEVWNFMQEAKIVCKSEALDGIDYSKIPLALEEDFEYHEDEHNPDDEHDMDDSRTPPQELCDVDIREETNETFNDTYNDSLANGGGDRLSASPTHSRNGMDHQQHHQQHHQHSPSNISAADQNGSYLQQNSEMAGFQSAFSMNNISATLEALNALRTGQFPTAAAAAAVLQNNFHQVAAVASQQQQQQQIQVNDEQPPPTKRQRSSSTGLSSVNDEEQQPPALPNGAAAAAVAAAGGAATSSSAAGVLPAGANASTSSSSPSSSPELGAFMEMQSKEHLMRMKILEVQLQAAKYSRDLVELNKMLAMQKLQEYSSKRMSS